MLITMLNRRRLCQAETNADMVARRMDVLNQICQPRNQLTRQQMEQLGNDNCRFCQLNIGINRLRSQITARRESVARIETAFRSSIMNSPMIEVNDMESATFVWHLHSTGFWTGTICICTNMVPDNLQQQILVRIEGIPRRFFTRDEQGNITFQAVVDS